jgi:hypothetical protein
MLRITLQAGEDLTGQRPMPNQKKLKAEILGIISAVFFPALALAQGWNKDNLKNVTKLPQAPVATIINNIVLWLLGIFGFVAVVGFVISGIMYLTAAGDEDRQETAKNAMIYSITGVLVGLAGLVVIYAIDALYGGATDF